MKRTTATFLLLATPLLMAAAGTEVAHRDGANIQRPAWSADGKQLSWEANYHEKKEIELQVGDPHSGRFTRIQPSARSGTGLTAGFSSGASSGKVVQELSWAPASIGRFVYSSSTDAKDYDLYISGGSGLAPHPSADGGAAWSPDGRHIAFTSARTGQGDLYLIDVHSVEAPPRRLTTDAQASELYVSWSPDGGSLTWVGHSNRGDNIWLLASLDGQAVQLTDWKGSQIRPTWSPAGGRVAFYANAQEDDRFDLYAMDARVGSSPTLLVRGVVPDARGPAWTPDGGHLVFTLNKDDQYDPIGVVSSTDSRRMRALRLGTVGHGDLDVAKGPDGKLWIAYVAQGSTADTEHDFMRLYVAEIEPAILP